jgi:hypothetical protein
MSLVYFISPVGSDPSYGSKREALDSIAEEFGVEFFFPLDRHGFFSVGTAAADLRRAWLVIADLSLERPSCYFEVGLAQGVGTPVAFMAAAGTSLHQAGGTANLLSYADIAGYREAVRQLIARRGQGDA